MLVEGAAKLDESVGTAQLISAPPVT